MSKTPIRKFKMLDFVHVCDGRDGSFCAIVAGDDHASLDQYSLYVIEDGKVVNYCAWYYDYQMELIPSDIEDNHRMITEYRWGNTENID